MEADYKSVRVGVLLCVVAVLAALGCADLSESRNVEAQFTHREVEEPGAVYLPIHSSVSNSIAAASEILRAEGWKVEVSAAYRESGKREDPYFEQVRPGYFRKPLPTVVASRAGSSILYEMQFEQYKEGTAMCQIQKDYTYGEWVPFIGGSAESRRITYRFKRDVLLPIKREAEVRMTAAQG